jgi:voltage-gated potassium channel Kch
LGVLSWLFGWNGYVSAFAVLLCNSYLVSVLVEASLRAEQEREFLGGVPQPKPACFMEFPSRAWTLLQVQFLLVAAIVGFANMYIKNGDVRYQAAATIVERADHKADGSTPGVESARLIDRIDALYYSAVTLSTVGYGDFVAASRAARLLVIWQLGTGMLMLLGVFPLIVGRISDF